MHQIVQFFQNIFGGACPRTPPFSMASRILRSNENTLCFKYCAPNMESWSAPEVLSLQCQTFGIQIRLDVLLSMIWVQLLFCRLHLGIIPNSWPQIFFNQSFRGGLSFEIIKTYLRTLVRVDYRHIYILE